MTTTIKIRRDTAANWTATNPILASGEPGLETDTLAIKYGDGATAWVDLPYGTIEAALTVINHAQANITSVGTLTNLSVAGNVNTANLSATGNVIASGNVTTTGNVSATGNVAFTGANVSLGSVANLHIGGGTANYVLSTDGAGNLTWKVDATNNMGNIVITGDNIGSSNDVVNIVGNNYAQLESNGSAVWVETDGAHVTTLDGDSQWRFRYDGTTNFPNDTIKSSPFGPGQFFTTQNIPGLQSNINNINPDGDNVVIVSKTSFPDITQVDAGWTLFYNGNPYNVDSVVNGTPVADNFYITLDPNPVFGPAEIAQGQYVQVGLVTDNQWWFDFEGSTQVPGNIYIGNEKLFNINGSHTHGVSFNSDAFSQLYWVPNIADTANVNPDGGGNIYNWTYVDNDGTWIEGENNLTSTNYRWNFTNDGNLIMPTTTRLNSGGLGIKSSAEFGTEVVFGPSNYTWWDESKKAQNIMLEHDRKLTVSSLPIIGSSSLPVLSVTSIADTSKVMYSFHVQSLGQYGAAVGVASASVNLTAYIGIDNNSIALYNNGAVVLNDTSVGTVNGFNEGDTVDIAVDHGDHLIWFRTNTGNWNNNSSANPATGTNGINITSVTGTLYPAVGLAGSDDGSNTYSSMTSNVTTTNTVPAGYTFIHPTAATGNVITHSEIYMGSGTAEGRQITDDWGNSLAYYGVENTQLPGFAGMVSSDPNVTSMYQIGTDDGDNILLGATTGNGELTSTDYRAALGVLNGNLTINGFYADQTGVIMSGGTANNVSTIWAVEEGIGVTNTVYPREDSAIDVGTYDKSFDSVYTNSIKTKTNLSVSAGPDYSFWYALYGGISATNGPILATNSGAAYDSGGNLYVMGIDFTQNEWDTLALKYNPEGDLIWRKAWVDTNDDNPCGSHNKEFFINDSGIYWMSVDESNTGNIPIIYVGSMNMDGVITTASTKIEGVTATDMIAVSTDVYVVGYVTTTGDHPVIMKINTTTNTVTWTRRLTAIQGQFSCVTLGNDGAIYVTGYVNDTSDYASISKFLGDGTHVITKKIDSNTANTYGRTVTAGTGDDVIVAYYDDNSGSTVVTKLTTTSNLASRPVWATRIAEGNNTVGLDVLVDEGENIYVTGTTYNNEAFYVAKLNQYGAVIWQQRIEGDAVIGAAYGSRMSGIYNDRIAITGYSDTDPYNGASVPPLSMTIQIPTDEPRVGQYGHFYISLYNISYDYNISQNYTSFTVGTINQTLPTFSNNNGFVPSTILKDPNYVPFRGEIAPATSGGWKFGADNVMSMPYGSKITAETNGSININGKASNNNEYNTDYNYIRLNEGTGNSQVSVDTTTVQIGVNRNTWSHYWNFKGDNYGRAIIQQPYFENYEIQQYEIAVPAATTQTIWIAQSTYVSAAKFTVHLDRKTANPDDQNYDTMMCEITMAIKRVGGVNTNAIISAYGLVHTSDDVMATFDTTIIAAGSYTGVIQSDTSGIGVDAEFSVTTTAQYGEYNITLTNGGTGYKVGDFVTISGTAIGGINGENDLTGQVNNIGVDGVITDIGSWRGVTYAGRVALTCTTIDPTYQCRVKVHVRESGSPTGENYC